MSMWASTATKVPSSSSASGLISASVMSYSENSRASRAMIGVSRCSALPVTPVEAMTSLASKSAGSRRLERCLRPTLSGWVSATSSMSIPPIGEKIITGRLRVPSHVTPA